MREWLWSLWNTPEGLARVFYGTQWAMAIFGILTAAAIVLSIVVSRKRDVLLATAQEQIAIQQKAQEDKANRERDEQIAEANRQAREAREAQNRAEQLAAPRSLTPIEKTRISSYLAKESKGAIIIKANITVADARAYADEIAGLLRSAGWTVREDNAIITGPDIRGVWITVKDAQAAPIAALVLQRAFAAGGITVRAEYDPTMPNPTEVWLSVGSK
jgi:glycine/D-amino acid oxidase-like deaminating enzyme